MECSILASNLKVTTNTIGTHGKKMNLSVTLTGIRLQNLKLRAIAQIHDKNALCS
jgi:hypothetical protein